MTDATQHVVIDGIAMTLPVRDAQEIKRAFTKLEDQLKEEFAKREEAESDKDEAEEEKKKGKKEAEDSIKAVTDAAKTEIEKRDAVLATKDAEIADLKKKLSDATSPATMDAAIELRAQVTDLARIALGDSAKVDFTGKSVNDVRKMVVDSKLGEKSKTWTDAQIEASFESITDGLKKTDGKDKGIKDAVAAFSKPHFQMQTADGEAVRQTAYKEYVDSLADNWKTKVAG